MPNALATQPAMNAPVDRTRPSSSMQPRLFRSLKKHASTPKERVLNVIGAPSCFGDWGVVNNRPRAASMVTMVECTVYTMTAAHYKRTCDPSLLRALQEKVQAIDKLMTIGEQQQPDDAGASSGRQASVEHQRKVSRPRLYRVLPCSSEMW